VAHVFQPPADRLDGGQRAGVGLIDLSTWSTRLIASLLIMSGLDVKVVQARLGTPAQ
jgi:hypothetical protein